MPRAREVLNNSYFWSGSRGELASTLTDELGDGMGDVVPAEARYMLMTAFYDHAGEPDGFVLENGFTVNCAVQFFGEKMNHIGSFLI